MQICKYFPAKQWVADKAYGSKRWRNMVEKMGAEAVVPPKKNTKEPWPYDKHVYKWRHLIENVFQRLKVFRRIASRYEKTERSYAAMASIGCILTLI